MCLDRQIGDIFFTSLKRVEAHFFRVSTHKLEQLRPINEEAFADTDHIRAKMIIFI